MTTIPYYLVAPSVVSERFDDEVIIVNMARGHYYSLRGSAAVLWQPLEQGATADTLSQYLATRYTVEAADALSALMTFLTQLSGEQLIISSETAPATLPNVGEPVAGRLPFVAPVLEVYTDMADLLALDPIHDVSSVDGWPTKK